MLEEAFGLFLLGVVVMMIARMWSEVRGSRR